MSDGNPFTGKPAEPTVNVETVPVEAEVDSEQKSERTYTGADLEQIVKDRLKREQKKLSAQYETRIAELEKKATSGQPTTNVEQDLRTKLSAFESEKKSLSEKLTRYQQDNLKATIERSLNAADCLDSEVVIDHFLNRNLVRLDDDGEVVVENATGRLDDLVADYLSRKPHLRRGTSKGGTGSAGPTRPATYNAADPSQMTTDQLREAMGVSNNKTKKMFSR